MIVTKTPLKDCFTIEPTVFEDSRGYFYEKFNERVFKDLTGLDVHFVQDNISKSAFGVVRGLHFQQGDHAQAKLVSCIEGKVFDVAVDLRPNSPTYKKWYGTVLSGDNKLQLFIPRGFAHGFAVLSEDTLFTYKCDRFYHKESEGSVRFDDPDLNIKWPLPKDKMLISAKDQIAKGLKEQNF